MLDKIIYKHLDLPYTLSHVWFTKPAKYTNTVVFLHGIGSTAKMWEKVANRLPKNVRCIAVDLLGHGKSPRPDFKPYDVTTQRVSLAVTLMKLRIYKPIILVGHSMGALVAVDFSYNHGSFVQSLILCGPPIYRPIDRQYLHEKSLRTSYKSLTNSKLAKAVLLNDRYRKVINQDYELDHSNINLMFKMLLKTIVHQRSLEQLTQIKKPVKILYGVLDPFVVRRNIRAAAKANSRVSYEKLPLVRHNMTKVFREHLVAELTEQIKPGK